MPELKINNETGNKLDLSYLRGVKILVNFWASYDAESHMENVLLWNMLQKEKYPIVMVSISFDKSKSVFEKTLYMDGISHNYQFVETNGADSKIYQQYQLEKGFKNYLIDEKGVIMAMDVKPSELNSLLKEQI